MNSSQASDQNLLETDARFLSDPALDGRSPGSEGHQAAAAYLDRRLQDLGIAPGFAGSFFQEVAPDGTRIGQNICGILPGLESRTILVGAHYDHFMGIPGADDNAAALAITLETARQLLPWRGRSNLAVCFFDLEEPPNFLQASMGSVYFVQHCPLDVSTLICAIIMDLCGHDVPLPGAENSLFVLGAEYRQYLVEAVRTVDSPGLPLLMARNERIGDMSDHHAFRVRGLPFLFLSCGWWEHYHAATDTFERLNLKKMQATADSLARLVRQLDDVAPSPAPAKAFSGIEAETFRRLTGLNVPANEADLNVAASRIIRKMI